MASQVVERVFEDALRVLRAVHDEDASGRMPYAEDIRALVEPGLVLPFDAFLNFFERYGFGHLDPTLGLMTLTQAGSALIEGDSARRLSALSDAQYHFADQLAAFEQVPPKAQPGVRIDGRYLRMDCLGSGSFGRVWRGRDLATGRPIALKFFEGIDHLNPGGDRRLVQRNLHGILRQQAGLVGHFIMPISDFCMTGGAPYVVTELAQGGNLRRLMDQARLAPATVLRYLVQIALGLRTAHRAGLIHGDLKPENILLDALGNVLLSDFAFTRLTRSADTMLRRAYVGYGSLGYMAPETFRQSQDAQPANDIYALGILMYEMFSGQLPGRRSPMPSQVTDGVPDTIDDIFDRMTRDPLNERITSIDDVLEHLWASDEICAMLDTKTGPFFVEPPVELPGLAFVAVEHEAVVARPTPSSPPHAQSQPSTAAASEPMIAARTREADDRTGSVMGALWSVNESEVEFKAARPTLPDGEHSHDALFKLAASVPERVGETHGTDGQNSKTSDESLHQLEGAREREVSVDSHAQTGTIDGRTGHRLNAEPSDEALKGRPAPQSRRPKPRGRKSSGPTGRPRVAKTTD
ncbi:MAG: serine/threonine-protein kinase, partial [Myxococcota bacterium]|nr:serine/threonine-protein kinase [Myxococcota bacterium]